jgi:selenocysteine-specific elongation factor
VRVHLGTSESLARLATFGRAQLEPGEVTWAQLRLETPLVARAGDRFVVRSYSPVHTVAGGTVAEPLAPRRKRLDEPDVVRLQAVLEGRAPVAAVVALNGRSGVRAAQLPLLTGRPPDELAEPPESDVFAAGDRLFPRALADAARTRMLAAVADFHLTHPLEQGAPREALRRAAGLGLPAPLLDQVTAELVRAGRLTARGPLFAEPGFAPRLDPRREELAAAFCRALAQAGIAAPRLAELPQPLRADPDLPAIARLLAEQGRVVAVAPDLYADPAAIRAARNTLLDSFREQPRQSASRLREVLGLTRKHLIPLLEFFDRSGVTRRDGDERVAGPAAQSASGGDV